jgi:hypothetical protein
MKFCSSSWEKAHTTDDGACGSELGQETGGDTTGGENDDGTGILLDRSGNSRHGQSLGSLRGSLGEQSELVKEGWVGESGLGEV